MPPEPAKLSELSTLLLPAIDGVAAGHETCVIHRTPKPDNIFLTGTRERSFHRAKLAPVQDIALTDISITFRLADSSRSPTVGNETQKQATSTPLPAAKR